MMTLSQCPDTEQLRRFTALDLPENIHHQVEEHLRQCAQCRQRVEGPDVSGLASVGPGGDTLGTVAIRSRPSPPREESGTHPLPDQTLEPAADRGTALAPGTSLAILKTGDRLDKYEILDVLGRGGMGVVFKAKDTILERTVAIKVLGPLLADNPAARKRFIREGQTAAAVKHQHVVTVYGVEGHEASPYLVLEYVEGRSLEDLLAKSAPLPVEEVVNLGVQIARGLAAAHQKGLIHRDIKPANILLEKETGRVALTDFGLARAVDDASISRSGEICGTPHYMAPEQVAGEALDHRADLFSLGSVLYYMCTGQLPFGAPTSMAVLHRVHEGRPRPIRECNPAVPDWLAELVTALHAREPVQRIQSAAEVAETLNSRGSAAATARLPHSSVRVPAGDQEQPSPASRPIFAIVLGLVFLASLPAFFLLTAGDGDAGKEEREPEKPVAQGNPQSPTPETPRENPEVAPPKPILPRPGVIVETVRDRRPDRVPEIKKPKPVPEGAKGVVVVLLNDSASLAYFQEEGLSVREQKTLAVVTLKQGRNLLAPGEYKVEPSRAGITIAPKRITVTADSTAIVNVNRTATSEASPTPGGGEPPPDRPPFPPPFPPPPGPHRGPPPRP